MKNTRKMFGFIAIIAVIGFSIAALSLTGCPNGGGGGGGGGGDGNTVATPTANPGAGAVASGTKITLNTATSGAEIWYTTNGSAPAKNGAGSTKYTSSFAITPPVTVKAIAYKDGMTDSGILSAAYTLAAPGAWPPANVIDLTVGEWAAGDIPSSGGKQYFKFNTGTETTVYIHFLIGPLSGAYVQMYTSDGTKFGTETGLNNDTIEYSYTQRTGLTANTEYYIEVRQRSDSGTYRIGVNTSTTIPSITIPTTGVTTLSADTWKDDNITSNGGEQWYKFTSTGTSQYIHFQLDTVQSLYAQMFDSDGTPVGTRMSIRGSFSPEQRSVTDNAEYYIMVYYSYTGTYKIGFTASTTPPIRDIPTTDVTVLNADAWVDGDIAAVRGEQWFSFTATAASHYIHLQPGTGTDALNDIMVEVYDKVGTTGTRVGDAIKLSASDIISTEVTELDSGTTYYIRVTPYVNNGKGAYKIGYNTIEATPVVEAVPNTDVTDLSQDNRWVNGNITTAGGAQWFSFTSSALGSDPTVNHFIHFYNIQLTFVYIQLYTTEGRLIGGRASINSYTKYFSRTLTKGTLYYIKVTPSNSDGKGTYRIGYNWTSSPPSLML